MGIKDQHRDQLQSSENHHPYARRLNLRQGLIRKLRLWLRPALALIVTRRLPLLKAAGFHSLAWCTPMLLCTVQAAQPPEGGDASSLDRVVVMKRFVVSATQMERSPWRYASLPGFEVLSRASEVDTNWWLDTFRRGLWVENQVIPKDWLPDSLVPYTVIIDDTDLDKVEAGEHHAQPIAYRPPSDALAWGQLSDSTKVWTDRFSAHDSDTYSINLNIHNVDTRDPAYGSISLERLYRCTPALPKWLMAGMFGQEHGIFREGFRLVTDPSGSETIRTVEGPGMVWISASETMRLLELLRKDPKLKIAMPPLAALFAETPPSDQGLPGWNSEAGLIVQWALMGPGSYEPKLSSAFQNFVRHARQEQVTEQLFTDCFGFGYAVMEEKLGSYLKEVLARPNIVNLGFPKSFPGADLQVATPDEVGRILGDWLRLLGNSVRNKDPEMSDEFLQASGRVLQRAYKDINDIPSAAIPVTTGEAESSSHEATETKAGGPAKTFVVSANLIRDPELLAIYGLYEHDMGHDSLAREFLETAMKANAQRPRARQVLAELRYEEALARPHGKAGKFSSQQTASILEPLKTDLRMPPVPGLYNLIYGVWENSEAKPEPPDIEKISEGVAMFPRNTRLTYRAASLCAQSGFTAQAIELIDKGTIFATAEAKSGYLERLRAELFAPPGRAQK